MLGQTKCAPMQARRCAEEKKSSAAGLSRDQCKPEPNKKKEKRLAQGA
jgi:hypothetical protein